MRARLKLLATELFPDPFAHLQLDKRQLLILHVNNLVCARLPTWEAFGICLRTKRKYSYSFIPFCGSISLS